MNIPLISAINISTIFNGLSIEQLVLAVIMAVLAAVFGIMVGACIFYPMGYKRHAKEHGKNPSAEAKSAPAPAPTPEPAPETFEDILLDEEESFRIPESIEKSPAKPIAPMIPILLDTEDAILHEPFNTALLEDEVFQSLVASNAARMPLINRQVVLSYAKEMRPIAEGLAVEVVGRQKEHYYDRLRVGGYTFALIFGRRKVLKVFLRLHPTTATALSAKAGPLVDKAPEYGPDWYSWIVTDIDQCDKLLAKALDMSYKYTAVSEFARTSDGSFAAKNAPYEDILIRTADGYDRHRDPALVRESNALNERYHLEYFSKSDACQYAGTIEGLGSIEATDYIGNRPAIIKVNGQMFAIIFENCNVVKIIFRADDACLEALRVGHPHVGVSTFPSSGDNIWYYAILDDSFDPTECKALLLSACRHVATTH
ncbi:MAG: hypothetical protein IJX70_02335 [Clostridia bacterium]|nr:hypothetical protein [Clostridia bacterium]